MAQTSIETKQQLIDIHVHGAETYDTRTRRQDDILQLANLHGERGIEVGADIVLKATKVDGVYDRDPVRHDGPAFGRPYSGDPSGGAVPEPRTGRFARQDLLRRSVR